MKSALVLLYTCVLFDTLLQPLAGFSTTLPIKSNYYVKKNAIFNPRGGATSSSTSASSTNIVKMSSSIASTSGSNSDGVLYSLPDQPARFAKAKVDNNQRYLDITSVYDPTYLKGKRVAITGANRGIGLALAKEVTEAGAKLIAIVRSSSKELDDLQPAEVISGVDVTDDKITDWLHNQVKGGPIDILINNAGYFKVDRETLDALDFPDQLKTIDICALGPLRITASLVKGGLLTTGSKVIMITSQGGSVTWRPVQSSEGGDYGHHMSKAAANMMAMLLAQELRSKGIMVGIFHPGFNKTEMTKKYEHIWEIEGAVDPAIGAKRVMYETSRLSMASTGKFINCEDGLEIPF